MVSAAVSSLAFSVGTVLLREDSGYSGPMPPSAIASGVTSDRGNEEQEKRVKSLSPMVRLAC